jgi:hypothetical protein
MSKNLSDFMNDHYNEIAIEQISEKISETSEKSELLDEIESVLDSDKSLSFANFGYVLLSLIFASMFIFPKIYIQQQIYFKSREISKLKDEYDTLKEENRLISTSVESIRFKNQVLDTLF